LEYILKLEMTAVLERRIHRCAVKAPQRRKRAQSYGCCGTPSSRVVSRPGSALSPGFDMHSKAAAEKDLWQGRMLKNPSSILKGRGRVAQLG
jgi:hypothetical protein